MKENSNEGLASQIEAIFKEDNALMKRKNLNYEQLESEKEHKELIQKAHDLFLRYIPIMEELYLLFDYSDRTNNNELISYALNILIDLRKLRLACSLISKWTRGYFPDMEILSANLKRLSPFIHSSRDYYCAIMLRLSNINDPFEIEYQFRDIYAETEYYYNKYRILRESILNHQKDIDQDGLIRDYFESINSLTNIQRESMLMLFYDLINEEYRLFDYDKKHIQQTLLNRMIFLNPKESSDKIEKESSEPSDPNTFRCFNCSKIFPKSEAVIYIDPKGNGVLMCLPCINKINK